MPNIHDHENEVTYFAKTNFRNSMTKFGIKTDDRRRHVYVIGKTGMGKTVLLENLILSDIYAGHGCCYVDPHGDTAEKLIDYIPSWRQNDVVYFNPADMEFPVGFNILETVSESHTHLVASGMMGVFKKIWENMWSSRMEYILNNTILALLANPGQTLLGINRMLSEADFRSRIVGNVTDPVVKQFWLKEFASYNDKYAQEAVAPIQNKIGQFLSASVVRNIVAQVKSTINIREIMDSEKIFIVNLSKGRIGEDNSRLLGGLLITKMQLSAMERVDTPEKERKDFYLYVDEFQNFSVESFAGILSEARKYRLCLTMAHQYIAQLTDEVREAVFGNVGTIITFRVGSPDGVFMEKEFAPRFLPEDIINLPKFNIYLKLLIDGVTSQPFSAYTLPPISQRTHTGEKVIAASRAAYANPRSEIESKILIWSGMGETSVEQMVQEAADKKKASKDSKKPKFEYDCTRCNKHMVLPVELDRSRPIYCEDCIELVREERKSGKSAPRKSSSDAKPREASSSRREETGAEEPSLSLETLKPEKVPEKVERKEVEVQKPAPVTERKPEEKAQTKKPEVENDGFSLEISRPEVEIVKRPVEKSEVVTPVVPPKEVVVQNTVTIREVRPETKPPVQAIEFAESARQERRPDERRSDESRSSDSGVVRTGEKPKRKRNRKKKPRAAGSGSAGKIDGDVVLQPATEQISPSAPKIVSSSPQPTIATPPPTTPRPQPVVESKPIPEVKPRETGSGSAGKPETPKSGTLHPGQAIKFE
ncbi:MAG: type IV secretion system DNA-binding domain-containing protein [Patescibacteria group bacterium]